jgi:predicted DNA-binding transcriptional regulator AlpA
MKQKIPIIAYESSHPLSSMPSFLTAHDLQQPFRLSRSALHRAVARGTLPRPIRFGPTTYRWRAVDSEAAVERLAAN